MKQLSVITSSDLIDRTGVQINKDGTRNVFAVASFGEDSIELARVVESLGIRVGTSILLETVFEEIAVVVRYGGREVKGSLQLPGAVSELGTGLPDVEMEDLLQDSCQLAFLNAVPSTP